MSRQFEIPRFEAPACAAVLTGLEAYVDGDLSVAEAAGVKAHLESCPVCAVEHRLALAVRRELRVLPELDAPRSVLSEIIEATEKAGRPVPFRRQGFGLAPWPSWARLAAAAVATSVLGAGLWWGTLRPGPPVEAPVLAAGDTQVLAADPMAVARATEEARYALAYLTRVHRRAGLKLRDDLFIERVVRPSARSLARSLSHDFGQSNATAARRDDRS